MSKEAVAVLVRARAYVEQGWVQHTGRMGDRRCAGQAIDDAMHDLGMGLGYGAADVRMEVTDTFHRVIRDTNIPNWNDQDFRTHGQVLRAFDQAIALATPVEVVEKVVTPKVETPVDAELAAIIEQANTKVEYKVIPIEIDADEQPKGIVKKVLASLGV